MELKNEFSYGGWTIKYALLEPSLSSANRSITAPIVFVHGTPWSSVTFGPVAEALRTQTSSQILLYDMPGYGESQAYQVQQNDPKDGLFKGDTSVRFQAEALVALLDYLHLDGKSSNSRPHLIAHDIAGSIVLRAHLLLDCQFQSLLLMDTNCVLPWGDGFYKLVRSQPEVFQNLPPHTFEAMLRATIRSACHDPEKLKGGGWEDKLAAPWLPTSSSSTSSDTEDISASERQSSFVRQIAQANDKDVAEMENDNLYESVRCPVKILWGEQDQWIPRQKMEKLGDMLRDGGKLREFVVVPEAGHLLMVDQPERVAMEVLGWLWKQSMK
ncbi:hypothetical protein CKM354_000028200 [Cercospora kikuchii]|uniref:AB hydrolase-1 domain-containing protein n=1 Tax=Cercospora kikuchii TaxID=84275 RepID=A0A9P3CAI2_9PEZI|nr:uncharacterized protein CKM354_000028200 [Cercospora kikuchii]GIZ36815.1 hypothetical protein CKM354_000028200 [Cercospora kikuchii]